jgi:hypothetical protein
MRGRSYAADQRGLTTIGMSLASAAVCAACIALMLVLAEPFDRDGAAAQPYYISLHLESKGGSIEPANRDDHRLVLAPK